MTYTKNADKIRIDADSYVIEASRDAVAVILAGEQVALLRPGSAVDTLTETGDVRVDGRVGGLDFAEAENSDGTYTFTWTGKSTNWDKTQYVIVARETHFEYFVRVTGNGRVDSVKYFIGNEADDSLGSEYEFDTGFVPIPTVTGERQCTFSAQTPYDEFSYLTIPPLFCYTFDICGMEPKLAFGLVADSGEHNFTKFSYDTKSSNFLRRFWFWTDHCGHTAVNGTWTSPTVIVYGTPSYSKSLEFYADYYYSTGRAARKAPGTKVPRFWLGPMACGWIEQAAYAMKNKTGLSAADMSYQETYDNFMRELHRRSLYPKIVIIDDKWQTEYGTAFADTAKWHDLRGWIDANLADNGCHTMLWYKLWDAEGLDSDMTMPGGYEGRLVADPTNPKYRELLRDNIHRMISSDRGCYNADGLKLDYAFWQPADREAKSYSGKYGVELLLEYISFIYKCVKAEKPEAIISASACHPVFAPYVDHARLHDYPPDLRRSYEEFSFRRDIFATAIPGVLIDTDGASYTSRRDTLRYLRLAPKLGIPDIYCITPMPSLEITDDEWASVAKVWHDYTEKADRDARVISD